MFVVLIYRNIWKCSNNRLYHHLILTNMQKTQQEEETITSETMQKVKKVKFADTKDMEEPKVIHENVIENANAENQFSASGQEDACHRQNVCRLAHTFL